MAELRGSITDSSRREAQPTSLESLAGGVSEPGISTGGAEPSDMAFVGERLGPITITAMAAYQDQGSIRDAAKLWDEQYAITIDAIIYPIKPGGRVTIQFTPDEGKQKGKKKEVRVEPNSALVGKSEASKDDPRNLKKKVHLNLSGGSLVSFKLLP